MFFLVLVVQTCMVVQHLQRGAACPSRRLGFHWRSWSAGLLAGGLLGTVLSVLTPFSVPIAVAMALVACVAGMLGHLVMKAIKRDRGVTHWGSAGRSVTGASGLLDRVDALCFAAPVFFHSVRWTSLTDANSGHRPGPAVHRLWRGGHRGPRAALRGQRHHSDQPERWALLPARLTYSV